MTDQGNILKYKNKPMSTDIRDVLFNSFFSKHYFVWLRATDVASISEDLTFLLNTLTAAPPVDQIGKLNSFSR